MKDVDWIEWKGGTCPVDDEYVDVLLRNGDKMFAWHCHHIDWGRDIPKPDHVIAYRVAEEHVDA